MGDIILQGPHHSAQKSITTGLSPLIYVNGCSVSLYQNDDSGIATLTTSSNCAAVLISVTVSDPPMLSFECVLVVVIWNKSECWTVWIYTPYGIGFASICKPVTWMALSLSKSRPRLVQLSLLPAPLDGMASSSTLEAKVPVYIGNCFKILLTNCHFGFWTLPAGKPIVFHKSQGDKSVTETP